MGSKRPELRLGRGRLRATQVLQQRSSTRTPDPVGDAFSPTLLQSMKLTGHFRDFTTSTWNSDFSAGPSDKRKLTGKSISTTPQYRGSNITAWGARGVWTGWPSANASGATYQLKAGAGPVLSSSFISTYSTSDVDYHVSKGENFFRVLINHEAAQPDPSALAIPYAGSFTNASRYASYWAAVKALVDYIVLTKGCTVVLDLHNAENEMVNYYNQRFRQSPGAGEVSSSILVDFWTRMATIFNVATYQGRVWFGIHNEPNQGDGSTIANWFPIVQDVINGIRGTGNTGKILVPGLDFTSSRYFVYNGSWAAFRSLTDSANNLAIQVHFYYDASNSGANVTVSGNPDLGMTFAANTTSDPKDRVDDGQLVSSSTDIFASRMRQLVTLCREAGVEIHVTEIAFSTKNAAGGDQTALATSVWQATMAYLNANADVIKGYCWWQSNGIPGHAYSDDQVSGVDSPMMDIIEGDWLTRVAKPTFSSSFTDPLSLASTQSLWRPQNNTLSGSNVLTVIDSGPAAKTLTVPSGATGPTYSSSSSNMNNKPTLSTLVSGVATANKRLRNNTLSSAIPYWFLWLGFFSTSAGTEFWGSANGNFDNSPGLTRQTDKFLRMRTQTSSTSLLALTSATAIANGLHAVLGVFDTASGAALLYVDDHEVPAAYGAINNFALSDFTIGSFTTATIMEWGEVAQGTGRPSAKDRRNLIRYGGTLYGFSTS